jgi:hypothetical protein
VSITPQDVPHLTDPNPGNHRIRPQEIGRIVQVLNAHRHPTTTMVDDNAPVETTRDSRESTDGAAPRLRAAEQPSSRLRDTFVGWTGFRGADARTRGLADVPVRELIARLAQVEDGVLVTPTFTTGAGESAALSEDLVRLLGSRAGHHPRAAVRRPDRRTRQHPRGAGIVVPGRVAGLGPRWGLYRDRPFHRGAHTVAGPHSVLPTNRQYEPVLLEQDEANTDGVTSPPRPTRTNPPRNATTGPS